MIESIARHVGCRVADLVFDEYLNVENSSWRSAGECESPAHRLLERLGWEADFIAGRGGATHLWKKDDSASKARQIVPSCGAPIEPHIRVFGSYYGRLECKPKNLRCRRVFLGERTR
jgi:hypothetical protein